MGTYSHDRTLTTGHVLCEKCPMSLGERIRSSREARGLTQAKLAELLGLSVKTVARWETDRHAPRCVELGALSTSLGVSLNFLVLGAEKSAA